MKMIYKFTQIMEKNAQYMVMKISKIRAKQQYIVIDFSKSHV